MTTKNQIILFFLVAVFVLLAVELDGSPELLTASYLTVNLIVTGIILVAFALKNESFRPLKRQYIKLSNIFLLGFIIVHYQIYIDYVLGNYENLGHDYLIDTTIVSKAIVVSNIALICFVFGYMKRMSKQIGKVPRLKSYPYASIVILVLAYIFLVFFLYNVQGSYFLGQYGQVDIGNAANLFQNLLIYSIYGVIILNCYRFRSANLRIETFVNYCNKQGLGILVLMAIYLPLVLISGDRGPILQIGTAFFAGFLFTSRKKYNPWYILGGLFIAINVISFIGLVRTFTSEANYMVKIEEALVYKEEISNSNSFSPGTMELAGTVRTLHAAISFSDENFHTYGAIQAYQLSAAIPGLGQVIKSISGLDESQLTSGHFLTQQIMGDEASFGLGTTCVADIYLDFGVWGVIFCFLLLGRFFRFLEERSYADISSPLWVWVLSFVFFAKAIYIGRSAISLIFRDFTFTFILLVISIAIGYLLSRASKGRIIE